MNTMADQAGGKRMRKCGFFVFSFLVLGAMIAFAAGGAKAPEEIVVYLWDDPTYVAIVDAFNQSQSQVIVKPQYITSADYETKLATMLAGGVKMDAFMQKRQTDMFIHYSNGYIYPLDDLIKKYNYDLKTVSSFLSAIQVGGDTLAIPFRAGTYYTYYNRKMFDIAGIPYPSYYIQKGEWTWAKFSELAKKLSTGDGKAYGGLFYTWGLCQVVPAIQNKVDFITQNGKIDIDDSVLKSYKLRKSLEQSRSIIPLAELKASKLHYSQAFFNGNVAMLISGEWFPGMMLNAKNKSLLNNFAWNDWGIARLPCDLPQYRSIGVPTFLHIHADSKKKDAAFAFLAWMGGAEGAKAVAKAGFLPAVITPDVEGILRDVVPDMDSFRYFTEAPDVYPIFYTKYGTRVEQVIIQTTEQYLQGDMSDADFAKNFKDKLEEVIRTFQ